MSESPWQALLAVLLLTGQLMVLRWPGPSTAPLTSLWALANAIFFLPPALMLATGLGLGTAEAAAGAIAYAMSAAAMGLSLLACELLLLRLGICPPSIGHLREHLACIGDRTAILLSLGSLAIRFVAFQQYGILFSGSRSLNTLELGMPGWFAVAIGLSNVGGLALVAWTVQRWCDPATTRNQRILALVIALLELGYALFIGRRWLLMFFVLGAFVWHHCARPTWGRVARVALVLVAGNLLLFLVFYSLRIGNWENRAAGKVTSFAEVERQLTVASRRLEDGSASEAFLENLRSRPFGTFIFTSHAQVVAENPFNGELLANSLRWAIPGTMVDKSRFLANEQMIALRAGLPENDYGTAMAQYAIADFGIPVGGLLYGLILAVVALGLMHVQLRGTPSLLVAITWTSGFVVVFQLEQDMSMLFGTARNMLTVLALVTLLRLLLPPRADPVVRT